MAQVKELRSEIRKLTAEVNVRIAEYRETGKSVRAVEQQIKRLQSLSDTKTGKGARGEIGLGLKKSMTCTQREQKKRKKAEHRKLLKVDTGK